MKIGKIEINKGVFLAPMEGITDLPFRLMCRRLGADIVYSEFIASEALVRNVEKSKLKMQISEEERPVAVQIFGNRREALVESAKMVEDLGIDILDINFGCWVKKVVNNDSGAAFLKNPERMAEVTRYVVDAVSIPVTAKTRLGWDKNSIVIVELASMLEQAGAAALTVHCRTRDMALRGDADWSWIPKIKANLKSMPLILNGDVRTPSDAKKAFDTTNCDAIMIGRAAVGNPFIFKSIKTFLETGFDIEESSVESRIDTCLEHLKMNIKYKGFPRGFLEFRKHYSGYLKGFHNGANIRRQLVEMELLDDVVFKLEKYRQYLLDYQK